MTHLPFEERLKLLRELAACTHICSIEGCDREAAHTCQHHPHPGYDGDTDYEDAGICVEHFGTGLGDRCLECQPLMGCQTKREQQNSELFLKYSLPLLENILTHTRELAAEREADFAACGFKMGEAVKVPFPKRWVANPDWQPEPLPKFSFEDFEAALD